MASDFKLTRPPRVRRIQTVAVLLLVLAGFVNFLDRGSLGIANTTIRADLGFSATTIGALLSIFSLAYAFAQLPVGLLLDRLGTRTMLSGAMLLWSLTQTATGWVIGFRSFVLARISLAMGEAPFVVSSVKTVRDWFAIPDRATPMGIVNTATPLGQALAPLILTVIMLNFGWRGMFILIGLPGLVLAVAWFALYRDRKDVLLDAGEAAYLDSSAADPNAPGQGPSISLAGWARLFRLRTIWGMMIGFGGVNYTAWLYISWMPGYFEAGRHVSIAATGKIATIPFFCGSLGMFLSGWIADRMVRAGMRPLKAHKTLLITGMTCSALCTFSLIHVPNLPGAVAMVSAALFFIYLAGNSGWGLVHAMAPASMVASVAAIQNFGSFICASFAPVVVGWLLDRTHSFHIALTICALVTLLGALSYLLVVKDPIQAGEAAAITVQ
jgi:sugar phosphate permease